MLGAADSALAKGYRPAATQGLVCYTDLSMRRDASVRIIEGDAAEELARLPRNSVDLIVTSPPYADSRKDTYGGIEPDRYVEWFQPIGSELLRVLKPSGTFILNIKERVVAGERHTYVFELIQALRAQGWLWTEEFVWHKKNSYPGKWPNRFRDGWERLLQFNKSRQFAMYQEAVMVPVGDWATSRLRSLSETDSPPRSVRRRQRLRQEHLQLGRPAVRLSQQCPASRNRVRQQEP